MKPLSSMLCLCALPAAVAAQTLRGSPASVDLMYTSAHEKDLAFLHSRDDIWDAAVRGELALININDDLTLERVSFPFVLPATRAFADSLAIAYHAACGERLVVTSGARPVDEQPRNASPKSVHPTGMAVDFRRPASPACLTWLRAALLALEDRGVVEATEEHHPPHFHVAVLRQEPAPPRVVVAAAPSAPAKAMERRASNGEVTAVSNSKRSTSGHSATAYRVRAGDNLWTIARRHGITTKRLQAMNGLKNTRLRVGQMLEVP